MASTWIALRHPVRGKFNRVLLLHDELHFASRADFGMGFHFNKPPNVCRKVPKGQWKLASYEVAGNRHKNKSRPARDDGKHHHKYFSSYSTPCF